MSEKDYLKDEFRLKAGGLSHVMRKMNECLKRNDISGAGVYLEEMDDYICDLIRIFARIDTESCRLTAVDGMSEMRMPTSEDCEDYYQTMADEGRIFDLTRGFSLSMPPTRTGILELYAILRSTGCTPEELDRGLCLLEVCDSKGREEE